MKKVKFVVVAAIALVFFTTGSGFAQTQVQVKEWQVPFLNCLTGAIASIGEYLEWGAERAALEINQAGGIKGRMLLPFATFLNFTSGQAMEAGGN